MVKRTGSSNPGIDPAVLKHWLELSNEHCCPICKRLKEDGINITKRQHLYQAHGRKITDVTGYKEKDPKVLCKYCKKTHRRSNQSRCKNKVNPASKNDNQILDQANLASEGPPLDPCLSSAFDTSLGTDDDCSDSLPLVSAVPNQTDITELPLHPGQSDLQSPRDSSAGTRPYPDRARINYGLKCSAMIN